MQENVQQDFRNMFYEDFYRCVPVLVGLGPQDVLSCVDSAKLAFNFGPFYAACRGPESRHLNASKRGSSNVFVVIAAFLRIKTKTK